MLGANIRITFVNNYYLRQLLSASTSPQVYSFINKDQGRGGSQLKRHFSLPTVILGFRRGGVFLEWDRANKIKWERLKTERELAS